MNSLQKQRYLYFVVPSCSCEADDAFEQSACILCTMVTSQAERNTSAWFWVDRDTDYAKVGEQCKCDGSCTGACSTKHELALNTRQFLPRDNSAVLKSTSTRAREGWTIISRSSVAKTLSEQRTYTTYNISEARSNRCSRKS